MKFRAFLLAAVAALGLSGCAMGTVDDLYCIPKRSAEHRSLQTEIDGRMLGYEYTAPTSGDNQQTVQMADLTGDGLEECLVFTKGTSEKPLRIMIFSQNDQGEYSLMDTIESNGNTFETVEYVQTDDHPGKELIFGRQLSNQVMRIASVYSFRTGQAEQVLSTIYSRMVTSDLDADGKGDLLVIRRADADRGNAVAMLYSDRSGSMQRSREIQLSEAADNIKRISVSKLQSGEPAVYVSSAVDESAIITDILAIKNGELTNLFRYNSGITSVQTLRNYYVYSEDIDHDGIIELPSLITTRPPFMREQSEKECIIRWYSIDNACKETAKMYTYHNYASGWYLQLDADWVERVSVEQEGNVYTFFVWNEGFTEAMPVFTLYAFTGRDRAQLAAQHNRFALYRGDSVVYAGKLETGSGLLGVTEKYLIERFHLVHQEWKTGET